MKRGNILVALVCVVFLMAAWTPVAAGQEQRRDPGNMYWTPLPPGFAEWQWWLWSAEPPPGSSYLPECYKPGDNIPHGCAHDASSGYGDLGREPFNGGAGVPAPGGVARWGGVAAAQERPDVGLGYVYEWWLGGAPAPPGILLPDPRWPWLGQKPVPISDEYLPPVSPPWYQRPHFAPGDAYSGYDNLGASIAREWYLGPDYFPYWYRMGAPIPWFSRNDSYFYLPELLPLWYQVRWFSPNDTEFGYDTGGSEPLNSGVGVPEPGTFVLLIGAGLCLFGCAWRGRRRR